MFYPDKFPESQVQVPRGCSYAILAVLAALMLVLTWVCVSPAQEILPIYDPPPIAVTENGAPAWLVSVSVKVVQKTSSTQYVSGTGTIVANNGLASFIVTCKHVLPSKGQPDSIFVVFPGGYQATAQWLGVDQTADLSMIWIPSVDLPMPKIAAQLPPKGTQAIQIGYPRGQGPHENDGTLIGPSGKTHWGAQSIAFQMHSDHGDSGSGIFNAQTGEMIAVLWGGDGKTTEATGVSDIRRYMQTFQSYLPPNWDQCPNCPRSPVGGGGIGSPTIINPPSPAAPVPAPASPVIVQAPTTPSTSPVTMDGLVTTGAAVGGIGLPLTLLGFWLRSLFTRAVAQAASPNGQAQLNQASALIASQLPQIIAGLQTANNAVAASPSAGQATNEAIQVAQLVAQVAQILNAQAGGNSSVTSGS